MVKSFCNRCEVEIPSGGSRQPGTRRTITIAKTVGRDDSSERTRIDLCEPCYQQVRLELERIIPALVGAHA